LVPPVKGKKKKKRNSLLSYLIDGQSSSHVLKNTGKIMISKLINQTALHP
jgi:hypothetical protein